MARTDQFLEDCFSQYEVIQTDVNVIWYVIENFKSYRPLLMSSLHLKYKKKMWTVQSKISVSTLIMKVYVEYIKQQTLYIKC
jgi:hypothetical protein